MRADFFMTSRLSDDGKSVVIDTLHRNKIEFIGASCKASAEAGSSGLNSLSVVPEKNKLHVLALRVTELKDSGKRHDVQGFNFLLRVCGGSTPRVDLVGNWTSPVDRLLQMGEYGLLQIQIGDDWFRTGTSYDDGKAGWHYNVDGDLMCRYAAGVIDADQFRQQVSSWVKEQSFKAQCEKLSLALDQAHSDNMGLRVELDLLGQSIAPLREAACSNHVEANAFRQLRFLAADIANYKPTLFPAWRRHRLMGSLLAQTLDEVEEIRARDADQSSGVSQPS